MKLIFIFYFFQRILLKSKVLKDVFRFVLLVDENDDDHFWSNWLICGTQVPLVFR